MKYIVKRPNGDTFAATPEDLKARRDNGAVRDDWSAKAEDSTEWSTVGSLLAAYTPPATAQSSSTQSSPQSVRNKGSSISDSFTSTVCRRYQDAYLVARATTAIGATVKLVGLGLGILVWLGCVFVGSQSDKYGAGIFGGFIFGAVIAIPIYILGVLVSAQGEVLKSVLDTAVHGSPFLKKEDMARAMSL